MLKNYNINKAEHLSLACIVFKATRLCCYVKSFELNVIKKTLVINIYKILTRKNALSSKILFMLSVMSVNLDTDVIQARHQPMAM